MTSPASDGPRPNFFALLPAYFLFRSFSRLCCLNALSPHTCNESDCTTIRFLTQESKAACILVGVCLIVECLGKIASRQSAFPAALSALAAVAADSADLPIAFFGSARRVPITTSFFASLPSQPVPTHRPTRLSGTCSIFWLSTFQPWHLPGTLLPVLELLLLESTTKGPSVYKDSTQIPSLSRFCLISTHLFRGPLLSIALSLSSAPTLGCDRQDGQRYRHR